VAKHLRKFTTAFQQSRIPFLLAEVITDGQGNMVDLVCRFANRAAASLLQLPAEDLQGQRFTRRCLSRRLAELKGKPRRFDKTVEKQAMEQAVLDFLK